MALLGGCKANNQLQADTNDCITKAETNHSKVARVDHEVLNACLARKQAQRNKNKEFWQMMLDGIVNTFVANSVN